MVVLEAANKVLEHIAAGVLFIITCKIFAFSIGFAGGQKIYSLLFLFPLVVEFGFLHEFLHETLRWCWWSFSFGWKNFVISASFLEDIMRNTPALTNVDIGQCAA